MNHSESKLEHALRQDKSLNIVGYLSPFPQKSDFRNLGTIGQHAEVIEKHDVHEVFILSHDLPYEMRRVIF